MAFINPSHQTRKEILENAKTIAVVGLSSNPDRSSYLVAEALQNAGYKIIPVNPNENTVLGQQAVASLADIQEPVDIVDVFRRSDQVFPIAKEAADLGFKVLWLQQGVYDEEAAEYAQSKGVTVIMDHCIKVDHALFRIGKK